MVKLKDILTEQDNTIGKKEWSKVEKTITRGMDMVFDKGVKYLRDYERSNLPPKEKQMLSDFWDDYMLLKNRFQKINKHLATKGFLKEAFPPSSLGSSTYSNKEAMRHSIDSVNKAAKLIGQAQNKAISIFTSDMKQGKYDRIDLSRSIHKGNIRDASKSKREVLMNLFYDLKDRFVKYGRRKK